MRDIQNVITIVVDSLREDHARLAALPYIRQHGIDFSHAYAPGCWTGEVYASIATGLPSSACGITARGKRLLTRERVTVAEQAAAAGWDTSLITANGVPALPAWGLARGFNRVVEAYNQMPWSLVDPLFWLLDWRRVKEMIAKGNFIALESKTRAGKAWLRDTHRNVMDEVRREKAKDGKKCISVNLMECHFPYHVNDGVSFLSEGLDKAHELLALIELVSEGWIHSDRMTISPQMLAVLKQRHLLAWKRLAPQLDAFVEELMADGKTAVIFLADHGDAFGEYDSAYHVNTIAVGANQVPLTILLPDGNHRVDERPVSTLDLYGTLLTLMGIQHDTPHLLGTRRSPVILETYFKDLATGKNRHDDFVWQTADLRLLHRDRRWYQTPLVNSGEEEPPWTPLDGDPIRDILQGEERGDMSVRFNHHLVYSQTTK